MRLLKEPLKNEEAVNTSDRYYLGALPSHDSMECCKFVFVLSRENVLSMILPIVVFCWPFEEFNEVPIFRVPSCILLID